MLKVARLANQDSKMLSRAGFVKTLQKRYKSTIAKKEDFAPQLQSPGFKIDTSKLIKEADEPLIQYLQKRGLVASITNDDLIKLSDSTTLTLYSGADPTARSLHLGNLLPLLIMLHYNIRGHNIVGLVGGATGKVGDPSGRLTERSQIKEDVQMSNTERIKQQLNGFLHTGKKFVASVGFPIKQQQNVVEETKEVKGQIQVKNNHDWWKDVTLLDFLSNFGRFIRVNSMLARDSVKGRLESKAGIGFNEFTYQVLQAYDFWHLFKHHNVTVQVGGNDQWGNITAGIDLISKIKVSHLEAIKQLPKKEQEKLKATVRLLNKPVFGLTVPLLTTSSGQKFGKSAGNAVFIDSQATPAFEMYNFFMKTTDDDIAKLLKIFTVIPLLQIDNIVTTHMQNPSLRHGQRILADQVVSLIHGRDASYQASVIASILYPLPEEPYPTNLKTEEVLRIFQNAGLLKSIERSEVQGERVSTLLHKVAGISKTEARNLVKSGGVYIGYDRLKVDPSDSLLLSDELMLDSKLVFLRAGKSKYYVVEIAD